MQLVSYTFNVANYFNHVDDLFFTTVAVYNANIFLRNS